MAGKRLGLVDQPLVHQAVADLAAGRDTRERLLASCRDERSLLAAEPMRYLHTLNAAGEPEWVVMEEAPMSCRCGASTRPYCAAGASPCGPASRTRPITAYLRHADERSCSPPGSVPLSRPRRATPKSPSRKHCSGPDRARWVSMAEALGWGATDRPIPTVCAGGGPGGGPEPFPSGSRKTLSDARARGTWAHRADAVVLQSRREGAGWAARHGTRDNRPVDAPAPTFTAEAHRWSWSLRSNNQANATVRSIEEPAGRCSSGTARTNAPGSPNPSVHSV